MRIIRFSLDNPLIVNLSLLIILIAGIISWRSLPQEVFPSVNLDVVHIQTQFEGAAPKEVEQQVTLVIEAEFKDAQDIDHISSTSSEGLSNIYIKLRQGSNVEDFIRDARTRLDRIDNLPDTAEEPELARIRTRFPVITVTLYGDLPDTVLYKYAEDVRQQIQQIPGVSGVNKIGIRDREIWVTVNPDKMAALAIPLEELNRALNQNLLDQPGGTINASEGDIRLRGQGVDPIPAAIAGIALRTNADGGRSLVGDVATVTRQFEEPKTYARFNGRPSVNLVVTKTTDASTITVADQVKLLVDRLQKVLPAGLQPDYHTDMSSYVKTRSNTVKSSVFFGLILILTTLYLLLNLRAAIITSFGIPVSFLFAIILLYCLGYTINMVSLFAFLIVLGMVVDDAIIITENTYRYIEKGAAPLTAARQASQEVFWPVVVSTLTTIAAFLPMFAIGGVIGAFIKVIPVVVCCALLGSLIEAFMILPAHAGHILRKEPNKRTIFNWAALLSRYAGLLRWASLNRYFVAVSSICVLIISLSYAHTRLPFQLFGDVEIGQFFLNIEAPNTYSLQDSLSLAQQIEDRLAEVFNDEELESMLTNVGLSIVDFNRSKSGSNIIQFIINLQKPMPDGFIEKWIVPFFSLGFNNFGGRQRDADQIIDAIRKIIADISGVQRLSILKTGAGPAGNDIEIGLASDNIELIRHKAEEIKDYLSRIPGVNDVVHDQEPGKLEYKYTLNDKGRYLGLTQSQLATIVRSGFLGNEVVHVTWDEERVPVRVIYPASIRQRSESLQMLPIVLANHKKIYLGDVTDIDIDRGSNQIQRRDHQRMAKVTADVDASVITPSEVIKLIAKKYAEESKAQGYSLLYLGEKKDSEESFRGMKNALIIALVMIFFMLTALFKSLLDPIVIMTVIPFGLIGVVIGHALFAYNLQFLSIVGLLALSGIIVNDSLIVVDFIRRSRDIGMDRIDAVIQAGCVRARPILLTTITTFIGLFPLIFFATGQTAFLSPMAVSLGFGLMFATILILLALPCFYLIADDIRGYFFSDKKTAVVITKK